MSDIDISSRCIPPQCIESERAVLGAILLDNLSLGAVLEIIDVGDFYRDAHKKIFSAILSMSTRNEPADLITLGNTLKDQGQLEKIGGYTYLSGLVDEVGSAANIAYYAKIIKEKAIRRAIIGDATRMINGAYFPEKSTAELINDAQQVILSLVMARAKSTVHSSHDIAKNTFALIEERSKRVDAFMGLPTGLRKLDELTLGLQAGELFIIAARPGMGKTALAIGIARHVAQNETPVLFYSAEMPSEMLMIRILSGATGIDSHKLRRGAVFGSKWSSLVKATEAMGSIPLFFDDGADVTTAELRAKARRVKAEYGIGLLIVDYIQLMRSGGRYETREREVADISRMLKGIARELNIPVIGLSQLNRRVDDRPNKNPQLSDIRESGAIEQDADVIAFIYREESTGTADIIIAKHRNGPTGLIRVQFNAKTQTFSDLREREIGQDSNVPEGMYASHELGILTKQ